MFNLSDLKKTRVYQEILEEVQAEAKQREKASILRMVSAGFTREEIATILDLPLTEVEAAIAKSQQN